MSSDNILNSIFDDISSNGCINISDSSTARVTIIKKCLFTNINGIAISIVGNSIKSTLSFTCFFKVIDKINTGTIYYSTAEVESNVTSVAQCVSDAYVSIFHSKQTHKSTNHSNCAVVRIFTMMVQYPSALICSDVNLIDNEGPEVFGVSNDLVHSNHFEVVRTNVVGTKENSYDSKSLLHSNLLDGSLTLREWNLYRNDLNLINPDGSILFDSCWTDFLDFDGSERPSGVALEVQRTFPVEAWNFPGCQFHTLGIRCSNYAPGSEKIVRFLFLQLDFRADN